MLYPKSSNSRTPQTPPICLYDFSGLRLPSASDLASLFKQCHSLQCQTALPKCFRIALTRNYHPINPIPCYCFLLLCFGQTSQTFLGFLTKLAYNFASELSFFRSNPYNHQSQMLGHKCVINDFANSCLISIFSAIPHSLNFKILFLRVPFVME